MRSLWAIDLQRTCWQRTSLHDRWRVIQASASFRNPRICCSVKRFFFMPVFSSENGLY